MLLLFAQARDAAGTKRQEFDAPTVGAVLDAAVEHFGAEFARVLPHCRVWRNGDPAQRSDAVTATDEVAVLPPVSGG